MKQSRTSLSRRNILRGATAAGMWTLTSGLQQARSVEDEFDELLHRNLRFRPEYADRLANHASMGAEARLTLGGSDLLGWLDTYRLERSFRLVLEPRQPIAPSDWFEALGRGERISDWIHSFETELSSGDWRATLSRWLPRLAPGLTAGAFHGLLRSAHAARALERRDNVVRRTELAFGLAYWAARYFDFRTPRTTPAAGRLPSQALALVPRVSERDRKQPAQDLMQRIERIARFTEFRPVADLVDASADADAFLSDLARTFATAYLTFVHDRGTARAWVHALTGPGAVRLLLPYATAETRQALLRYAWQGAAAIYAGNAPRSIEPVPLPSPPLEPESIRERACKANDAHALKLSELCLREYARAEAQELLVCTDHALELYA